jgi:hypothetical protein
MFRPKGKLINAITILMHIKSLTMIKDYFKFLLWQTNSRKIKDSHRIKEIKLRKIII